VTCACSLTRLACPAPVPTCLSGQAAPIASHAAALLGLWHRLHPAGGGRPPGCLVQGVGGGNDAWGWSAVIDRAAGIPRPTSIFESAPPRGAASPAVAAARWRKAATHCVVHPPLPPCSAAGAPP
jgi:hypothetical protein